MLGTLTSVWNRTLFLIDGYPILAADGLAVQDRYHQVEMHMSMYTDIHGTGLLPTRDFRNSQQNARSPPDKYRREMPVIPP